MSEGATALVINQLAEGLTLKDMLQNMPEEIGCTGLVNMPISIGVVSGVQPMCCSPPRRAPMTANKCR